MTTILHASVYAFDPKQAAEHLAALTGGRVEKFQPFEGAWVCLLGASWNDPFIELYPRKMQLHEHDGDVTFAALLVSATGAGTHFNLKVDRSRSEIEATCTARGLKHGKRSWADFIDVWLDEGLLIEITFRE